MHCLCYTGFPVKTPRYYRGIDKRGPIPVVQKTVATKYLCASVKPQLKNDVQREGWVKHDRGMKNRSRMEGSEEEIQSSYV